MSTNKTEHYGLHSWAAEDDFLRTEINENFAKLDGVMVSGTYQGDDQGQREIVLGFRPRLVVVCRDMGLMENGGTCYGGVFLDLPDATVRECDMTDNGFVIWHHTGFLCNSLAYGYHYLALR